MGIFTYIGTSFESSISSFVATTASGVIGLITPVVLTAVTLYFTITAYMIMAGRISDPLGDVMIKGAKIALIAMVGLSTGNFMNYVVGAAQGLEGDFLGAMGSSAGNIYELLDNSWTQGYENVAKIWAQVGDMDLLTEASGLIALFIAGLIASISLAVLCSVAAGTVMIAKISLVVVLGFGPLFICALMFPTTANYFSSWLNTVLTYIFTSVIAIAFLVIFLQVYMHYNDFMTADLTAENMDAEGSIQNIIYGGMCFLIVSVVSIAGMRQVPSIASSLVGGMGLQSASLASMLKPATKGTLDTAKKVGKAASSSASFVRSQMASQTRSQQVKQRYISKV